MEIDFGVAYIKENSDVRIKITMNEFRGKTYIHLREYGYDGDTGNIFPTKKGITIDPKGLDLVIFLLEKVSKTLTNEYKHHGQYNFKLISPDDEEDTINGNESLVK